jgi:hypothetical protein
MILVAAAIPSYSILYCRGLVSIWSCLAATLPILGICLAPSCLKSFALIFAHCFPITTTPSEPVPTTIALYSETLSAPALAAI